jgi:C4-dicarboxylate-specific signal transduction histidine kinase
VTLEAMDGTHDELVMNGVSVQTKLAENLPLIQGDRVQLQQVMLNLIINAIEAMSERRRSARPADQHQYQVRQLARRRV